MAIPLGFFIQFWYYVGRDSISHQAAEIDLCLIASIFFLFAEKRSDVAYSTCHVIMGNFFTSPESAGFYSLKT